MDLYDFIHALRKDISNREEQIQDILMTGGVKDMQNYQYLMGELSSLSYIHAKIKEHLEKRGENFDD
jgi:hypothetical protein